MHELLGDRWGVKGPEAKSARDCGSLLLGEEGSLEARRFFGRGVWLAVWLPWTP